MQQILATVIKAAFANRLKGAFLQSSKINVLNDIDLYVGIISTAIFLSGP